MKKSIIVIGIMVVAILLATIIALVFIMGDTDPPAGNSPYEKAVAYGYSASREVFLAALVGETVSEDESQSAYTMACNNGYTADFDTWMKDLTGSTVTERGKSAYAVACEHGYAGTLADWITSRVNDPDSLGKSGDGEQATEYQLACEYGFKGSFAEWLVSLVNNNN